jgi:hypothetical protein
MSYFVDFLQERFMTYPIWKNIVMDGFFLTLEHPAGG